MWHLSRAASPHPQLRAGPCFLPPCANPSHALADGRLLVSRARARRDLHSPRHLAIARCLGECRSLRSRARLTSTRAAATGSPAVMLTASPIVSATRSATAVEGRDIIFPKEFQRRGALWVYLTATAVSDNWRPLQCAPALLHPCFRACAHACARPLTACLLSMHRYCYDNEP